MDFYVYAHFDQNNSCRYIGKGRANRAWAFDQRSKRWDSIFQEIKPIVKILDKNLSELDAYQKEAYHIAEALKFGEPLLNVTAGGESFDGWDERARQLLSDDRKGEKTWTFGKARPQETRDKISATKQANPESVARYWQGKKRDPELMARVTKASLTPEAIEKRASQLRGKKHSEEHKKKIKESTHRKKVICVTTGKIFESMNDAAKETGISCGRISEIANGIRKSSKGMVFEFIEV
jgi:chemotaxis protein histidine kinase CheA